MKRNDQVYKIRILQGNCTKYDFILMALARCRMSVANLRTTFLKILENIKNLENQTGQEKIEFYIHFPEISGLKFLLNTNSVIFIA